MAAKYFSQKSGKIQEAPSATKDKKKDKREGSEKKGMGRTKIFLTLIEPQEFGATKSEDASKN